MYTPSSDLKVGSTHQGFLVTSVEPVEEISGYAYVMTHVATGARLLWLACDDTNRSFAIAFKTPPADDTGVFHILEHSVLCGSRRFPVKEPFVNLLKTSMQTFLNALTFSDKTMYPVASTNLQDLENLMDVYLDAVLDPAIYERPRIFEQEGWHLELDGPDEPLRYNGVVFNEMKGALSDPDDVLYQEVCRRLFPDTAYGFESGGNPAAIPSLTYEKFIDTHRRHYNLRNSHTILYGDLDIERELAFVGTRFDAAPDRGTGEPNALTLQQPVTPGPTTIEMATASDNATIGVAYVLGTSGDRERVLAASILTDVLAGSNEAPLKRAVLDAGIGDDFWAVLVDGILQPFVLFQLKGAKPGAENRLRALIEETCARLAADGLPRQRLDATIAQAEFALRERNFDPYPDGVALSMSAMSSWLYDEDDPLAYIRYERTLPRLKEGVGDGRFDRLLAELVRPQTHSAEVRLVPVESDTDAAEAKRLAALKATMGPEELQSVMDEVAALRAEQERPDAPEDLAKLPKLGLDDLGEAPQRPRATHPDAPLPCVSHELETRQICYVSHYFDLARLTFEDLPYVGVLSDVLGKLDTSDCTADELDTRIQANLGSLDVGIDVYPRHEDPRDVSVKLTVEASSLMEKVEQLATIPSEVWSTTLFSNKGQMLDVLQQRRVALEQNFVNAGHSAAVARLLTYFLPGPVVIDAVSGVGYYRFLKDLLAHWDELYPALAERLSALSRAIFSADDVTVSFTGCAEGRERFWECGGTLGLAHRDAPAERRLVIPAQTARNEAFAIPSTVCYVVQGQSEKDRDALPHGVWPVVSRAVGLDYLWNEVRVKGGAYGVGFRRTVNGSQLLWSYRDPHIDETVERYAGLPSWLASWTPTQEELDGFIVSAVAALDAPVKPFALARRQDQGAFCHRPKGWRRQTRDQELACTVEQVRQAAPLIAQMHENPTYCVFGPREKIEASGLDLTVEQLMD